MGQSYFRKVCKKKKALRIICTSVIIAVAVILVIAGIGTWYSNDKNPFIVKTQDQYESAQNSSRYVKITAPKLYDLGLVMNETTTWMGIKTGKSTKARFVAMNLDGKLLSISLPTSVYDKLGKQLTGGYVLKGKITEFDEKDLEVFKDSLIKQGVSEDKIDDSIYTGYLDYQSPAESGGVFFLFAGIVVIIGLVILAPSLHKNSVAVKSLKDYSNGDVDSAYKKIDNEVSTPDTYKNGPITITQNYIIGEGGQFVVALPSKELMWAYKKTLRKKTYGITTGKYYSVVLIFSDKTSYDINFAKGEQKVNETIGYINEHIKTCVCGYSDELSNLFKRNPNEFINQWKNNNSANA